MKHHSSSLFNLYILASNSKPNVESSSSSLDTSFLSRVFAVPEVLLCWKLPSALPQAFLFIFFAPLCAMGFFLQRLGAWRELSELFCMLCAPVLGTKIHGGPAPSQGPAQDCAA